MTTVSYTTLGCKLNFSETAEIIRTLTQNGYTVVDYGTPADLTIINSCTVTAQAERKSVIATKKASKISPNGKVVVIGCAAQINPQRFAEIKNTTHIIGTKDKFNLLEILTKIYPKQIYSCDIANVNKFDSAFSTNQRTRSFLKIQDGCDYKCTYCAIPKSRGKSRNTTIKTLIAQANQIAETGTKEIVLTGVNIGDFGKTTQESLYQLLVELNKIQKIQRYRISSIEPNLISSEIIKLITNSDKFMPHLHIPLQSGSDKILKLMHRRYTTDKFISKIKEINTAIPNAFIGVDIIVGFPGETDENFNNTYNLLASLPISYLHIFPYSDRIGTIAANIKPKVPSEKIKKREHRLKNLSNKKHNSFIMRQIGASAKILFEANIKDDKIFGYSENYIKVCVKYQKKLVNSIVNVKLEKIEENIVYGKTIK